MMISKDNDSIVYAVVGFLALPIALAFNLTPTTTILVILLIPIFGLWRALMSKPVKTGSLRTIGIVLNGLVLLEGLMGLMIASSNFSF